jgi:4-hydroxybenzoate polyprenyltransferase
MDDIEKGNNQPEKEPQPVPQHKLTHKENLIGFIILFLAGIVLARCMHNRWWYALVAGAMVEGIKEFWQMRAEQKK